MTNFKTGVLAAAAVLSLAVPAAALAQPFYGSAPGYGVREDYRREEPRRFERDRFERARFEREQAFRREEALRRLRWEREHAFRYGQPAYR